MHRAQISSGENNLCSSKIHWRCYVQYNVNVNREDSILKGKKAIKRKQKTRCTSSDTINTLEKRNHVLLEIGNENWNQCNANFHEISKIFRSNKRTSCHELREIPRSENSSSNNITGILVFARTLINENLKQHNNEISSHFSSALNCLQIEESPEKI